MALRRLRHPQYPDPDEVRMTLGEHLEELRSRLIKAIVALFIGSVVVYIFSDYVMGFLCAPIFKVLEQNDYPAQLNYLTPAEAFLTDIKVSLIVGIIITAPYSLTQIWGFVAAGLYPHERRWVHRFAPVSIVLFFVGALFLLIVVSPMLLNFLVSYRTTLPNMGKWMPNFGITSSREILGGDEEDKESAPPEVSALPKGIPAFKTDPTGEWPEGVPWLNRTEWQIRIRYGDEVYKLPRLVAVDSRPRVMPLPRISEYILFILHLSAAFGIGFQVPVVVAFIAAVGISNSREMAKLRRYVWLGMAVGSAIITPPDVTSMIFLLVPMALLYEVGLFAARFIEAERRQESA
jgi:sec-independent protein translocase protein TatC